MHTKISAFDINYKENINGEKTLTFSLPAKYRNEEGILLDNPLLKFLTSERKVKLRDGNYELPSEDINEIASFMASEDENKIWTDFIIKEIQEDSTKWINTYTCKELHVNELGKNGYSVLLDDSLGNNYGTLEQLSRQILDGSGWQTKVNGIYYERVNEPLFEFTLKAPVNLKGLGKANDISLITDTRCYTFYSQVEYDNGWKFKSGLENIQIIYSKAALQYDDQYIVVDDEDINYNVKASDIILASPLIQTGTGNDVIGVAIQGGKFVDSQLSIYEPVADKQVLVYKKNDKNIYVYADTQFLKPTMVRNLLANQSDFVNTSAWTSSPENNRVVLATYPILTKDEIDKLLTTNEGKIEATNYLVPGETGQILYNEGLRANNVELVGGNKFGFRLTTIPSIYNKEKGEWEAAESENGSWTVDFGYLDEEKNFISVSSLESTTLLDKTGNAVTGTFTIDGTKVTNYDKTVHEPVLKLICSVSGADQDGNFKPDIICPLIKEISLFNYYEQEITENGTTRKYIVTPGETPEVNPTVTYHAYQVEYSSDGKTMKQLATWKDDEEVPTSIGTPVMNDYAAIRHINVKESNYFNNVSDLAELFGWWISFEVLHEKSGKILYKDGVPQKVVHYSRYHGNDYLNNAGFRYGINEKSIQRNNDSKSLVTKLIVNDNSNEYAENGICSIRAAQSNPTGDSNIYNFTYYINQGLLRQGEVLDDLYGVQGGFNYYNKIHSIMEKYKPLEGRLIAAEGALAQAESGIQLSNETITAGQSQLEQLKHNYEYYYQQNQKYGAVQEVDASGQPVFDENNKPVYVKDADGNIIYHPDQAPKCVQVAASISVVCAQINQQKSDKAEYEKQIKYYNELIYGKQISDSTDQSYKGMYYPKGTTLPEYSSWGWLKDYNAESDSFTSLPTDEEKLESGPLVISVEAYRRIKQKYDAQFYAKYSRYIQEGTWSDESYIDSELYYLDAKKVSDQNAYPKTTYTISVVDVSCVEKYAAYKYRVGDRTYIEDTEFFGYQAVPGYVDLLTPVKKEVIVSERSRMLDDPSRSTITIKTYKNQYEDLFSKITATTQSLQSASGGYQRAANIVQPDGSIRIDSLADAFNDNAWTIAASATNQYVEWDSGSGITITDLKNALAKLRITSNGLSMTTDGGETWINGITANGINTTALLAGTITTDQIKIASPSRGTAAFNWVEDGLSAISRDGANKYVRFNEYGLFGTTSGYHLDELLRQAENEGKSEDYILNLIKENSNFSLTWNGMSLSYQDNSLSLSQLNGLEIFPGWLFKKEEILDQNGEPTGVFKDIDAFDPSGNRYQEDDKIPVLSVGRYYTTITNDDGTTSGAIRYGMIMRNAKGEITFEVNEEGSLSLSDATFTGKIHAQEGDITGKLLIGVEDTTAGISGTGEYAFWAGSESQATAPFSVTHNGHLVASDTLISGIINADGGSFKDGTIENAIISNAIISQTRFDENDFISYIGKKEDREAYININDSFLVKGQGDVYGEILYLERNEQWLNATTEPKSDEYNIIIGQGEDVLLIYDPRTEKDQKKELFKVSDDGNVFIGGNLSIPTTTVRDRITLGDEEHSIILEKTTKGASIHTSDYTSSVLGAGWNIDSDGTATFNNAIIRGTLSSVVFEYNKVSAVGGNLLITPSIVLTSDIPITSGTADLSAILNADIEQKEIWSKVDKVKIGDYDEDYTLTYSNDVFTLYTGTALGTVLRKGTSIVSRSTQTNSILLTAQSSGGPRIEMTYAGTGANKVVIGNLEGVADSNSYFSGMDLGYGLYADNAFLTGKLYLPNAGITNEGDSSTSIRFWAGAVPDSKEDAPFRVLQDGTLYASQGIFSGVVQATNSTFSGLITASGIQLLDTNKETVDENEGHFFISLCNTASDGSLINSPNNYIADFDQYGLNLWKGSLSIFSDTYSGTPYYINWANADQAFETHYPFSDTPFPSLTFVDEEGQVPHLSSTGLSTWLREDNEVSGIKLFKTSISFNKVSPSKPTSYLECDKTLWNSEQGKISLEDNKLNIDASDVELVKSTKGSVVSINRDTQITSINGDLKMGNIQIESISDGLIFNYIGDE